MGLPDVFTFNLNWFIGVGISFSRHHSGYGRTLDISISLPFIYIGIFCRKVKENKWICHE